MADQRDLGYQLGLLSFIRPTALLRMAHRLPTLAPRRLVRMLGIAFGGWVSAPLGAVQRLRRQTQIDAVVLDDEPVFVIGHWRSGTTHLHNLMSLDEQFGCLRMFEALAPDCSVTTQRWLPSILARTMPQKRPMDNMEWPMDAPQEEEISLAKVTPYSWYAQFLFPKQAIATFDRYVMMKGAPARARREFKRKYLRLLKIAAIHDGKPRLLLKNPVNTARIPMLLELFPKAKFVFIHRSPYQVFPSAVNLHRKILELTSLQDYTEEEIERNVITMYRRVIERYLADAQLVPNGQLIEVGYQELVDHPIDTLRRIYDGVGIDGFDDARPAIEDYLESISGYRTNSFEPLSARRVELINREWKIGFDAFGYQPHSEPDGRPQLALAGSSRSSVS
ncbi:MAG: sulfotransferase family protein [Acidimicrobiales bacterium]